MNLDDWRTFAAQTKTEAGAIVACETIISVSLIDDPDVDLQAHLARAFEQSARAFYDRDDCEYIYLSPAEYTYTPGPFAYRHTPGDIPRDARLFVGRVRVRRVP